MVEKVLKSIDRPRPQVRITALMYDISLQDIEKLGINWKQSIHGHPDAAGKPQTSSGSIPSRKCRFKPAPRATRSRS